jgi:hypothetical protein
VQREQLREDGLDDGGSRRVGHLPRDRDRRIVVIAVGRGVRARGPHVIPPERSGLAGGAGALDRLSRGRVVGCADDLAQPLRVDRGRAARPGVRQRAVQPREPDRDLVGFLGGGELAAAGGIHPVGQRDPRLMAQWNPGWYGQMVAYTTSVGLSPTSDQGQLDYLQHDLRTTYSSLLSKMDTAPYPGTAAEMFEPGYELCQGVVGYMDVLPGSLCEDSNRKLYAAAALAHAGGAATSVPTVAATGHPPMRRR